MLPLLRLLVVSSSLVLLSMPVVVGLRISFAPHTIIRTSPPQALDAIMSSFEPRADTVLKIHRLLKYPKYNFFDHHLHGVQWSEAQQEEIARFIAIQDYHDTLFRPEIILQHLRLLEAIFPSDEIASIVYKGNIMREIRPSLRTWQQPLFPLLALRALKHALVFEPTRTESWSLLEEFIIRSPQLSGQLFEYLTLHQRMTSLILSLYCIHHRRFDGLLKNTYFYDNTRTRDEMTIRALTLRVALSHLTVNDATAAAALRAVLAECSSQVLSMSLLPRETADVDLFALAQMARHPALGKNHRALLWNSVALKLQQIEHGLDYPSLQGIMQLITELVTANPDFIQMVPHQSVLAILECFQEYRLQCVSLVSAENCRDLTPLLSERLREDTARDLDGRLKFWLRQGPLGTVVASNRAQTISLVDLRCTIVPWAHRLLASINSLLAGGTCDIPLEDFGLLVSCFITSWFFLLVDSEAANMAAMFPRAERDHSNPSWDDVFDHWTKLGQAAYGDSFTLNDRIYETMIKFDFYLFSPNELRQLIDSSFWEPRTK